MKYVSRNMNLRIVLEHALPSEPLTGRLGKAGNYVKFESGLVSVTDPKQIEMMERHAGFGSDFIRVEEEARDPYEARRSSSEPEHDMIDITHGGIGKNRNPKGKPSLTPDQKQYATEIAREIAADLVKGMREEIKSDILKSMKADSEPTPEALPEQVSIPEDVVLKEVEPPAEVSGDTQGPSLEDTLASIEEEETPSAPVEKAKTKTKKATKKVATESAE